MKELAECTAATSAAIKCYKEMYNHFRSANYRNRGASVVVQSCSYVININYE